MRIFVGLLLFALWIEASPLLKEVENIIGKNTFVANKKIIRILFKNEHDFYHGRSIDYLKVLQKLKSNNLLKYRLKRSSKITMSFATAQKDPLLFMKLLKIALNNLGYSTIETQKVIRDESGFLWKVVLSSDSAPDPILLARELYKHGARVVKIKRYSISNWRYLLNISYADLVPKKLPAKRVVELSKPLEPYWFDVESGRVVVLKSKKPNRWHPYIVFYDKHLGIVDNFSKDIKSYNVRLEVPKDAKYMKISDLYTLDNIKRGLTIYLAR